MPNVGPWEIILVLIVALLLFGPKRLPEMGKSVGKSMREFKDSLSGKDDDEIEQHSPVTRTQELPPAAPAPAAASVGAPVVAAPVVPTHGAEGGAPR
jgi:sec-independent protein translocase protein TatA